MFFDTHCHIFEPEFDPDREEVFKRAITADVRGLVLPAIDGDGYARHAAFHKEHPDNTYPLMGLHPTSITAERNWKRDLVFVHDALFKKEPETSYYGIGEIGLDYHWSTDLKQEQIEAFTKQLEWAVELNLPICVHTRDAWDDMVSIITQFKGRGLKGVFHAFSANTETALKLLEAGEFVFGIGGAITYKNSSMTSVARELPLDCLVLETDCPYLSPVPHRGSRNEPSYIPLIAGKIASIREISVEEVAETTSKAAKRIFSITNI